MIVLCCFLSAKTSCAAGSFELVSRGNDGSLASTPYSGDHNGNHSAISANGRYVVFRSSETGFVSPATTGKQIFLRDTLEGTTELISRNDQGEYGNGASDWPSISNDGCRVVYESIASNLIASDKNNAKSDVFMLDRCANQPSTTLVSVNSKGVQANIESKSADISGNGNVIVFTLGGQIYKRDLAAQTTELVSRQNGDPSKVGNFGSNCPVVSDDGARVAFWSYANNLVSADSNGVWDIFLYDVNTGMQLVSSDSAGVQQKQGAEVNSSTNCPAISGDGRYVAFASGATTLVAKDTNGVSDIFVKDSQNGKTNRASINTDGAAGNAASLGRPALSLDGTWIVFLSDATNLATETDGIHPNIISHNNRTRETIGFADVPSNDYPAISDDMDGRYISAFWGGKLSALNSPGVFVYDRNAVAGNTNNQPPIADVGPRLSINLGEMVTLDAGASTDQEGVPLIYKWSQLFGPEDITLSNPKSVAPTFTPTLAGTYIFQLLVHDDQQDSKPSFIAVDVFDIGATTAIQVDAGADRAINIGDPVTLKSTIILEPAVNKKKLKYQWQLISGPVIESVPVKVKLKGNGKSKNTGFTLSVPGIYVFGIQSSQGAYKSQWDIVTLEVNPSITVTEPTAATVWQVGTVADVSWNTNGINPNKKLAIIFSPDRGGHYLLLKSGVKAGKGKTTIRINGGMLSEQAFVSVCLLQTPRNNRVCGALETFKVQ